MSSNKEDCGLTECRYYCGCAHTKDSCPRTVKTTSTTKSSGKAHMTAQLLALSQWAKMEMKF